MCAGLLGFVAVLTLAGAARSQDDFQRFTSKAGGFTLLMPTEPKTQTQNLETAVGTITVTMYIAEKNGAAYFASFNDYPAELVQKSDPQAILDGARDGAVNNVKGKLLNEKKIAIGSHPGRDITFEAVNGQYLARSRMYLVNQRLYQIMVLAPREQGLPAKIDQYLDSFQLIN